MQRNDIIQLNIIDFTSDGAGFGRIDNMAIFVMGAVPGDLVKAKLTRIKKNFAEADLVDIVNVSEHRVKPDCPYFDKCGGCSLRNFEYMTQLEYKRKQVFDKLERLGGISNPIVNSVIGMDKPFNYRNKGEYPAFANEDKSIIGFYEKKSHKIVDVKNCLIQSETADLVSEIVRKYNKGEIKQLILKTALGSKDVMIILECDPEKCIYLEDFVYESEDVLYELGYTLSSVYTLNNSKYKLIAGNKTIKDVVKFADDNTLKFEISAPSFYQVNTTQMIKLYEKAAEYAGLNGNQTVLDIYCGIGTIGLSMARSAKKVIGIEIVPEAVIDANRNAVINGIVNARYICGKAEEILPKCSDIEAEFEEVSNEEYLQSALSDDDIVAILDPPRAGCEVELLNTLCKSRINKIVYISCDPATLARDIKILCDKGFRFIEATPVDMFPFSMHVEVVSLLSRTVKI